MLASSCDRISKSVVRRAHTLYRHPFRYRHPSGLKSCSILQYKRAVLLTSTCVAPRRPSLCHRLVPSDRREHHTRVSLSLSHKVTFLGFPDARWIRSANPREREKMPAVFLMDEVSERNNYSDILIVPFICSKIPLTSSANGKNKLYSSPPKIIKNEEQSSS